MSSGAGWVGRWWRKRERGRKTAASGYAWGGFDVSVYAYGISRCGLEDRPFTIFFDSQSYDPFTTCLCLLLYPRNTYNLPDTSA